MAATIYVNSAWTSGEKVTINGVEYTVGVDAFTSYSSAYNYAIVNAKDATIVLQTNSGQIQNEHKNYQKLNITAEAGTTLWYAGNKLDMTYDIVVKAGASLNTNRPKNSTSYVHVKNNGSLTLGEAGAAEKAVLDFGTASNYHNIDFAVLYNGSVSAVNAVFKVGDLGLTGPASFNDCEVVVEGALSTGLGVSGKLTLVDTDVKVNGHNNRNDTYFKNFNQLKYVTMTNSSITIDDGVDGTVAANVELNSVTMTDSDIVVEAGTAVKVAGALKLLGTSTLTAGVVDMAKDVTMDSTSSMIVTAISGAGTLTVNVVDGTFGVNKIIDFAGDNGSLEGINIVINKDGYSILVKDGDIFLASAIYVGDAPEGVPAADVYTDIVSAINAADGRCVIISGKYCTVRHCVNISQPHIYHFVFVKQIFSVPADLCC